MRDFEIEFWGKIAGFGLTLLLVLGGLGFGVTWGHAHYKIFLLEMDGKAKLAEAEYSKRIMVEDAKAKRDSAVMLAEAEVEQAKGVAAANKIIGDSLEGNEAYLRYLWVKGLTDGSSEVIYIPTEAGLPLLEATRGSK